MVSRTGVKGSRSVLLLSVLSLLPLWLAAQATQASKPQTSRVKPGEVHFEDIAQQAGLTALNLYGGDAHKEFIMETTGNGAVIFDYDNDGWPDIYLPNGSTVEGFPKDKAPTAHLYHNNHDGTFTDVTSHAGLARPGWIQLCGYCPQSAHLHKNLGLFYGRTGNVAEAKKELRTALELAPNDTDAQNALAVLEDAHRERVK